MIDIKKVEDEARALVTKEQTDKATKALAQAFRELALAEQVVIGARTKIENLKAQIADGSL